MYLLAMPLFSFYIPLYSFWHFDDFSWGILAKQRVKELFVNPSPAAATAAAAGSHAHGVNTWCRYPDLCKYRYSSWPPGSRAGGHMRAPNAGAPNDEEILREVRHILGNY
ncbi:hypothetical protein BASA60_004895 [Batrachochytrium salamandrivorans]|nr:hypothetical protein BASA60_004895 [Batrachochytrium salamandrivorans]